MKYAVYLIFLCMTANTWADHLECDVPALGIKLRSEAIQQEKGHNLLMKIRKIYFDHHEMTAEPRLHNNIEHHKVIVFHESKLQDFKLEFDLAFYDPASHRFKPGDIFKTFIEFFKKSQTKGFRTEITCSINI